MQFVDTHTHIYTPEFDVDRPDVVLRALENGVTHMILPNIDVASIAPMQRLCQSNPSVFSMAMGLHPSEVNADFTDTLAVIKSELFSSPDDYVAVGEVGIDLYWDTTFCQQQMDVFERQLTWADTLGKPVIIHCRNGLDQTLDVLSTHPNIRAIFHCFGGDCADVDKIRRVGDYFFGIGGVVTFKKSTLPEALPVIGLDRIVTETDAPYLAPTPFRGKRNESAYIPLIAQKIADVLNTDIATVSQQTTANATSIFGL